MAIVEKQARIMALSKQYPAWIGMLGSIGQCFPILIPFLAVLSHIVDSPVTAELVDLCFAMVEYFPLILLLESLCTLRGYTTVAGAAMRVVLVGPLSSLGLVYFVVHTFFNPFLPSEFGSMEAWIGFHFVLVPLLCGMVLSMVFAAYFAVANHDSVLLVGDLTALALVPVLFIVPYFLSFATLVVIETFGAGELPEYEIQLISAFLLVFPATFILFEQVFVIAFARVKKRWSHRFFFGNDINEDRCFTVPASLLRRGGLRSWVGRRKDRMEKVPASHFLLRVNRPWGERYRRGSIARNLFIYFRERVNNRPGRPFEP